MQREARHYLDYMERHGAEFSTLRQDLHRYPELGFEEFRTSDLVARCLADWGYEVERGLGGTGVVGRLRRGTGARSLGIRADMDALPIEEKSGLPYTSARPGLMHACGHDGHTAMLLGAARYLAERGEFSGTVNLIFQPAEEGMGGALRMMEDGLFDKYPCDAIYAMHNMPGIPQGRLVFREGPFMASSDYATVTLTGVGGHGAMPHLSADPVVAAASIVMALQTIVARNADPQKTAIVTVGAIHAGVANNVIPQSATLEISVRAMDAGVRAMLERRLKSIVEAQASGFGVQATVDYRKGYTVLINSPAETELARAVGRGLVGEENVEANGAALTGSEDFSFMLEKLPGCYFLIGNGAGDGHGTCMVHNPGYDFNDANLPIGAAYWSSLVESYLQPDR
jgi:hippurate hydrolase